MNLDGLNRWFSLGANVGVFVGLLLLAFELDQNRDMIRAQTRSEIATGVMQLMSLPASNPQLAAVIRRGDVNEELTPDEHFKYRRFHIATLHYYENAHYQYRQGMYDEAEFFANRRKRGERTQNGPPDRSQCGARCVPTFPPTLCMKWTQRS